MMVAIFDCQSKATPQTCLCQFVIICCNNIAERKKFVVFIRYQSKLSTLHRKIDLHPSIGQRCWGAGANPSCLEVKAGSHRGQVPRFIPGPLTVTTIQPHTWTIQSCQLV